MYRSSWKAWWQGVRIQGGQGSSASVARVATDVATAACRFNHRLVALMASILGPPYLVVGSVEDKVPLPLESPPGLGGPK